LFFNEQLCVAAVIYILSFMLFFAVDEICSDCCIVAENLLFGNACVKWENIENIKQQSSILAKCAQLDAILCRRFEERIVFIL